MEYIDWIDWFPKRLSQLRMEKGVSARDMSLSLGQSESYINKIENKRTMPSMAGFFYICEYLDISPMDFFDRGKVHPQYTDDIITELNLLSTEKAQHILQVIRDLNDTILSNDMV